jgi:DNA-binding response OmpR family regulator
MQKPRILIIEDDEMQAEIYEDALADFEVFRARTGREALAMLPRAAPGEVAEWLKAAVC